MPGFFQPSSKGGLKKGGVKRQRVVWFLFEPVGASKPTVSCAPSKKGL